MNKRTLLETACTCLIMAIYAGLILLVSWMFHLEPNGVAAWTALWAVAALGVKLSFEGVL